MGELHCLNVGCADASVIVTPTATFPSWTVTILVTTAIWFHLVSLFGSLARGNYAPGSDADIFILLKEDARRFTDRIPEFLTHFSGVGLPVEVFPYTIKEIMEMKDVGFIKNIQRGKIVLDERGRI